MNEVRADSCGPLCLAYISGASKSECANLANTSMRGHTDPLGMGSALEALGFRHVAITSWTKWEDLQNGNMVLWWSNFPPGTPDGHWSVVVARSAEALCLWDPDIDRQRWMPRAVFESRWYDFTRDDDFCRVSVSFDRLRGAP